MRGCKPVDDNFDTSFLDEFSEPEQPKHQTHNVNFGAPFDVPAFMSRNGIEVHKEIPVDGGTKWQLTRCPFNPDHRAPDSYIQQFASGAVHFKCSHTSCSGNNWRELRAMLEPRPIRQDSFNRSTYTTASPPPADDDDAFEPDDVESLIDDFPRLHDPVIEGMLRRGETANIIAAPKVGKSWLVYDLCFAIATGGRFLGRFQCRQGRVLLLDNELHKGTLANRIRTVADGLGVRREEWQGRFKYKSLRGEFRTLPGIAKWLQNVEPRQYDLIVIDAFYRTLPGGVKENANEDITDLYNLIDQMTMRLDCAWVNVHHASKGSQSDKSVTDVGAGAGAQSRAADTHIVLRPHQTEGIIVLDAVCRSFPPIEPLALRWEFPCFVPEAEADPKALAGKLTGQQRQQQERDAAAMSSVLNALKAEMLTARQLRAKTGLSRERLQRLLDIMEAEGQVTGESVIVHGNDCRQYRLPGDVGDADRPPTRPPAHVGRRGVCGSLKGKPPTRPRPAEDATHVEDQTDRPRGTADDPIPFTG